MDPRRLGTLIRGVVALVLVFSATGCGAGLIAGIASSSGGNGTAQASPPDISVSPIVPLVPATATTRSIVVANVQLATTARLRVRIDALGTGVDQGSPAASGQGGSTLITFTLATDAILAQVADPTAADVPAQLSVFVDDRPVATPVPIVLARQPRAELELPAAATEQFVSPHGERVLLRVAGLRSAVAADLQMLVTTRDPTAVAAPGQPVPTVTRGATDLRIEPADGGDPLVSALLPGNSFPGAVAIVVRDAIAGISTTVTNAYYRPDVAVALPSQGATTGGSLVTLIGNALVPFDFDAGSGPAPFRFDDVTLVFAKGRREIVLPREDFRIAESGSDRLVFTMPPSPDGRPGQVDIVLRVRLGDVTAVVVASQVFLFANPDPFFGPRGVVFDRLPIAIAPIPLDQAPSTDVAPDFAALSEQGETGFLQLLLAQQNGMFQPFAAPRQIGDHEVLAERGPRDLCVGDFDGDGTPDVFIANAGDLTAIHHLVLGQRAPLPPLGSVHRWSTAAGMRLCRPARLDGDALPDVLLVPGSTAAPGQRPIVLLSRPVAVGEPAFAAPVVLPVRAFAYEAVEVADLDSDGHVDIALLSGTEGKLDVAWGVGDGTFTVTQHDFTVPGYQFDPSSPAVGVHACHDDALQSLGLVFAGVTFVGGPTPPVVTLLPQTSARVFSAVATQTVFLPSEPVGKSLVADLDDDGKVEMVLAIAGSPQFISLGLLQLTAGGGFQPIEGSLEGGIVTGAESPRQISALVFDRAFPASSQVAAQRAVFMLHEAAIDGVTERRLSTRIVLPGTGVPPNNTAPKLLPPDAGAQVGFQIRQVVGGRFRPLDTTGNSSVRDLALARTVASGGLDAVVLVENTGGFGGVPALGDRCDFPGLLPHSLVLAPGSGSSVDMLVFGAADSRLGCWRHDTAAVVQQPDGETAPLRLLMPDPALRSASLGDRTRTVVGDVDGDGRDDIVVLMSFDLPPPFAEGQSAIALLRGKSSFAGNEFPFHEPSGVTLVHGSASALVLGDFARMPAGEPTRLELAVAVPSGVAGDHVRFFRYEPGATPADDRFVPGAAAGGPQVLLAGSNPTRLAAADFDRNGTVDLLVASSGDGSLHLFRNTAAVGAGAGNVLLASFGEGLGSPWQLGQGEPQHLQLSDVNGDGNPDAVVITATTNGGVRSTAIGIYLSRGDGLFDDFIPVSPSRMGNRNATLAADLGDWNRDGLPDLLLGWSSSAQGDINLRVLFGGTR